MTIQNLIRPTIKALKPYSSARDEFQGVSAEMVFLDANENPFENGVNRYPDPHQNKLKTLLSQIKNVPTQNMLLGNGSDEVLDLIFRMFCEPYVDNVIILPPTYGMYEVLANLNAVKTIKVPLSNNFQPEIDSILNASNSKSKILFLCSPNNPTGNSFSSIEVETLLNKFGGIVVIDEAYIDFSKQSSWLDRLEEFPNLIVTQTLSKAYGMAGIRLGICYASTEIIATLNTIKPPYNVNELTQNKAIENLKNANLVKNQIGEILKERTDLINELNKINFISKIFPSDANFILIKVDDANKRYNQLISKGIVIRNRTNQHNCENCLRITVGTRTQNKRLLKILKDL
ncbi:histidinol-phosphate transaminase [Gaetbulibacter aquiaggeris]|uniref:Histidinol-phosphate aminotransferase n=1 Tax=Gaetbulibacter aquiaggeris TaxID=1735373 RepID=A0ABW7MR22_9FLAO